MIRNRKSGNGKRFATLFLIWAMLIAMIGCGNSSDTPETVSIGQSGTEKEDLVYLPTFLEVKASDREDLVFSYYNIYGVLNGYVYYEDYRAYGQTTSRISYRQRVSAEGLEDAEELGLFLGEYEYLTLMTPAEDGSSYALTNKGNQYYLTGIDGGGRELYRVEITQQLREIDTVMSIAADSNGRLYCAGNNAILLYDENGVYQGIMTVSDSIGTLMADGDGNVYYTCCRGTDYRLVQIDYEKQAEGAVYQNFPSHNGPGSCAMYEGTGILVNNGNAVMLYDMGTQTYSELFSWSSCDIVSAYVEWIGMAGEGQILAVVQDKSDLQYSGMEMVCLTATDASQVTPKTEIVLGAFSSPTSLEQEIVAFNKSNGQYHITLKTYVDLYNFSSDALQEARETLNLELVSGNAPDLFLVSGDLDLRSLANAGAIEDLTPYLENSGLISRENFVEEVLEAYKVNGILTCIPKYFYLSTVFAKSALVGEEPGWTLDEMMALVDAYPDAEVMLFADRNSMLELCLNVSQDAFIDWENGTCHFDSAQFQRVLEFANRFPEEYSYDPDRGAVPDQLAEGDLLLLEDTIYSMDNYGIMLQMFGGEDVTMIGYPTGDGSPGALIENDGSSTYIIFSSSGCKEGAWAFLESCLTEDAYQETDIYYYLGFPSQKELLEAMIGEAMTVEYRLDENGEKVLDGEGEPIIASKYRTSYDGVNLEYAYLTQEDVNRFWEILENASSQYAVDERLLGIIEEEAEAYFAARKSLEEVCSLIQSRASIYVSE